MAKRSSTIHIEECFWELIDNYQLKHKISSRNTAIECLLSEYRAFKEISFKQVEENTLTESTNSEEKNIMLEKIRQMEDDMLP